jgi:hypothetical protein
LESSEPERPARNLDELTAVIGRGQADFERARAALLAWRQFDIGWVENVPAAGACRSGDGRRGLDPTSRVLVVERAVEEWWVNGFADLIVRTVQGEDMFKHPRTPEILPAPIASVLEAELAEEQALQMKLADWLARRRQP